MRLIPDFRNINPRRKKIVGYSLLALILALLVYFFWSPLFGNDYDERLTALETFRDSTYQNDVQTINDNFQATRGYTDSLYQVSLATDNKLANAILSLDSSLQKTNKRLNSTAKQMRQGFQGLTTNLLAPLMKIDADSLNREIEKCPNALLKLKPLITSSNTEVSGCVELSEGISDYQKNENNDSKRKVIINLFEKQPDPVKPTDTQPRLKKIQ